MSSRFVRGRRASRGVRRRPAGKNQAHAEPGGGAILEIQTSLMESYDVLDQCEAQPCAARATLGLPAAHEWGADADELVVGDSRPRVFDPKLGLSAATDDDPDVGGRVLQRVVDDVAQGESEQRLISAHEHSVFGLDDEPAPVFIRRSSNPDGGVPPRAP